MKSAIEKQKDNLKPFQLSGGKNLKWVILFFLIVYQKEICKGKKEQRKGKLKREKSIKQG